MAAPLTLPLFPSLPTSTTPAKRPKRKPRPALVPRPPGPQVLPRLNVSQLWLAVHFPQLALDALSGAMANVPADRQSLAILDPEDRVQSVLACNECARERGVRAGQPLNVAFAFDATLLTLPRDAFRERQFLERIAARCQRFTPVVSLAGADELLLEVKGSLRLFGGAAALLERVRGELQDAQIALALTPAPQASLWLARSARGGCACITRTEDLAANLGGLPLSCLRWPQEVIERLVNMGVGSLGELARLPRGGLARRIGLQWLEELDRAFGRSADVRRRFEPRERYEDAWSPDCEIETVAGLEALLGPLFERLHRFLRQREAVIGTLVLELKHRAGSPTRVRLGLAAPSSDAAHLHGLLQERLASLVLPAPVIGVQLRSGVLRPAQAMSARLPYASMTPAARAVMPDALPRLIERMQARLGREAVFGLATHAEHRPELAWRAVGFSGGTAYSQSAVHALRPVWLLAEPDPLRPARWRIESGPERIESGWWDGGDIARDYFVARDPAGARGWIYRERHAPHRWFLQGLLG